MSSPSTVKDIIDMLLTLPQDLPCYVRPKYNGTIEYCDDVPINVFGIAEMHPDNEPKNITFLV